MVRKPMSGVLLSSAVHGALGQGAGRQKQTRERWLLAGLAADGQMNHQDRAHAGHSSGQSWR